MLRVEHLTREGVFTDVSLSVHAGEIVALAGLMGAGRSEVARAIFGIDGRDAGGLSSTARQSRLGRRPPRWRQAWGSCPKTDVSRAWSWTWQSTTTWRSLR